VEWLDRRTDAGVELPAPREWVVRENKWRAARHGIDAELIVDAHGSRRPARDEIAAIVDELDPIAASLGCRDELGGIPAILEHGPSYRRQRAVVEGGGTLVEVVGALAAELATDCPAAAP
jgi:carboxylate-amine ligase